MSTSPSGTGTNARKGARRPRGSTRWADATSQAYTASLLELVDAIAAEAGIDATAERTKLSSVYAGLVGTLQLSRALTDAELADALLEQGAQNAVQTLLAS